MGAGIAGARVMDMIGVQRLRGRDLATGIVLGAAIGGSALFLYLGTTTGATTGATQQILFGSIFTTTPATVTAVAILGVLALASIAAIARPLLLATLSTDIAVARVPVPPSRPGVHAGLGRLGCPVVAGHRRHPLNSPAHGRPPPRCA